MMKKNKGKKRSIKRKILYGILGLIILAVAYNFIFGGNNKPIIELDPIPADIKQTEEISTNVALIQSDKANAKDFTEEDIRPMVRQAVKIAGGLEGVVEDGDTVVLKPNFMAIIDMSGSFLGLIGTMAGESHNPEKLLSKEVNGVTTDYRVTKAVAELVRELNPSGKIYVMEGSGNGLTAEKYELMGYTHEEIPYVDEFISMDESGNNYETTGGNDLVAVDIGDYGLYDFNSDNDGLAHAKNVYYVDKRLYEADVLISIPALKNHQMASVTGAIKNVAIGATPPGIYGGNPFGGGGGGPGRGAIDHSWEPLNNWIHDYFLAKPIDFVVTDGLQSLEMGPLAMSAESIEDVQMNKRLILAGKDALAVDTVHALITGVDPEKVKYLVDLGKDKVRITDTSRINVIGNVELDDVRELYRFPGFPYTWMNPVPRTTIYEDFKAPQVTINDVKFKNSNLKANIVSDEPLIKLDVYIDGKFVESIKQSGTEISLDYKNKNLKTNSNLEIYAYDKYLNSAKLSTN